MLLISFLVACFFTISIAKSLSLETQWESFKTIHGKSYSNEEEEHRKTIFHQNLLLIEQHNEEANQGKHTYRLGITKFADLSTDEMKSTLPRIDMNPKNVKVIHKKSEMKISESVDWRSKGILTSVKDQGDCGSCYSFATVATIESAYAQKTGKLIDLSEQSIVDCAYGDNENGCYGGFMIDAYKYVKREGIAYEECHPYVTFKNQTKRNCKDHGNCLRFKIQDYQFIDFNHNEKVLAASVAEQVVTIGLDGERPAFYLYKEGIIDTKDCHPIVHSHYVALVGYGTENGTDYWIFKNSRGADWGENGYGRLARGKNTCGVAAGKGIVPLIETV